MQNSLIELFIYHTHQGALSDVLPTMLAELRVAEGVNFLVNWASTINDNQTIRRYDFHQVENGYYVETTFEYLTVAEDKKALLLQSGFFVSLAERNAAKCTVSCSHLDFLSYPTQNEHVDRFLESFRAKVTAFSQKITGRCDFSLDAFISSDGESDKGSECDAVAQANKGLLQKAVSCFRDFEQGRPAAMACEYDPWVSEVRQCLKQAIYQFQKAPDSFEFCSGLTVPLEIIEREYQQAKSLVGFNNSSRGADSPRSISSIPSCLFSKSSHELASSLIDLINTICQLQVESSKDNDCSI